MISHRSQVFDDHPWKQKIEAIVDRWSLAQTGCYFRKWYFQLLYLISLFQNCLKTKTRELVLLNVLLVAGVGLVAILSALLVLNDDLSVGRKTCARLVSSLSPPQMPNFKIPRSIVENCFSETVRIAFLRFTLTLSTV